MFFVYIYHFKIYSAAFLSILKDEFVFYSYFESLSLALRQAKLRLYKACKTMLFSFTYSFITFLSIQVNAATPVVTNFGWTPANVVTNQATYFKWDVKNVQSCTSNVSGVKEPKGSIGPVQWSEPRESTAKWFCTDLDGKRYPSNGFLESTLTVSRPKPKVNKFYWSPSRTTTGRNLYFYWDVENVTSCWSDVSGEHPSEGRLGPYNFSEPRTGTTRWYCTDLNGERFPTSGYLEASHTVEHPAPSLVKHKWNANSVLVNQPATVTWSVRNVTSCTNTIGGGTYGGADSQTITPTEDGRIYSELSCIDLNGDKFPSSGTFRTKLTVHPAPKRVKFAWSPSTVTVGEPTTFIWQIDNVRDCTSINSGLQEMVVA